MTDAGGARNSGWQRFLKGKTSWQRFLIAMGAIAGALLAIGAVIVGVVSFVGDRVGTVSGSPEDVQVVESQEKSADKFVRLLIEADGGAPLQLNHQLIGRKGPGDVTLEYNCQSSGRCSTTRVQAPSTQPADLPDGVWYVGCWTVTKVGAGYGAHPLDLQLNRQGEVCPH